MTRCYCRTSPLLPVEGRDGEGAKLVVGGQELNRELSRKARMLYDYDAVNADEVSINAGEVRVKH